MISTAVVAHEARIVTATDLARSLDAVISVDDGSLRAEGNHLQAWRMTAARESDWSLVLEDDALPVPGFLEQAEQALTVAPAPIVSLYLGRSRPPGSWQRRIAEALAEADRIDAHWIDAPHLLHAVAVAMRSDLRDDWLAWARTSQLPIDERLSQWARLRGHRVAYSLPSLCDHLDGSTLIAHRDRQPRTEPRVAWRTGTHEVWNRKTVTI